jgi:hypothetical protein
MQRKLKTYGNYFWDFYNSLENEFRKKLTGYLKLLSLLTEFRRIFLSI